MSENMTPSQDRPGKKRKVDDDTQVEPPVATKGKFQNSIQNSFGLNRTSDIDITDLMTKISKDYRMEFPPDFSQLWKFCVQICPSCPKNALLESLGFSLCGPYDILSGKEVSEPFLHCRYHLDPPEVQTVISVPNNSEQLHYGYFRDDPNKMPAFIVSAIPSRGCVLRHAGDNVLEVIYKEINSKLAKLATLNSVSNERNKLTNLKSKLEKFAANCDPVLQLSCNLRKFHERKRKSQGTTFHKLGISVYVKNDIGYRPIHHDDATLRKMMEKVAQCESQSERVAAFGPLHEQITFVQFANDESDFGMGLELGLNFFLHGAECFHKAAGKLLPTAYKFLKRDLYGEIIEKHLGNREKDPTKILYLK